MKRTHQFILELAAAALLAGASPLAAAKENPGIQAVFGGGMLTVTGDNRDNSIVVSRDPDGALLVNGGAIPIKGRPATVHNTAVIWVLGLSGNDQLRLDESNGPLPPAQLFGHAGDDLLVGGSNNDELDGGPGHDTLRGEAGDDRLVGGDGNDTLQGGPGFDHVFGGDGDDDFVANPEDQSDLVEGEAGEDALLFYASDFNEIIVVAASDSRLRVFRNIGPVEMDCDGVEQVAIHALGGEDRINVHDLAATQLNSLHLDLHGQTEPESGDGQMDTIIVHGTEADDSIRAGSAETGLELTGLKAHITIVGGESALDELVLRGAAGNDVVDASAIQTGEMDLTLDGGPGDDTLLGSQGNDLLIGASGDDIALCGPGDDTFVWNPGDGSDAIEGQAGSDILLFNGSPVAELMELSANGSRLQFTRNVGNIVMDCDTIEQVAVNALGGADGITVHDLSGTAVTGVTIDLAASAGSATSDQQQDVVSVHGTLQNDLALVIGDVTGVSVVGLPASVLLEGQDPTLDQIFVNLIDGDDLLEASSLQAGLITLIGHGGDGNDVLIGSDGADILLGGLGDDVLIGGLGLDELDGGPGDNLIIQD